MQRVPTRQEADLLRRTGANRSRGEGHVEYVIITSLIMVCALVGMFSWINELKLVSLEKHLCVECPANLKLDELEARIADARAKLAGTLSAEDRAQYERALTELLEEQELRATREALADSHLDNDAQPGSGLPSDSFVDNEDTGSPYSQYFDTMFASIVDIGGFIFGAPFMWNMFFGSA